MLIVMLSGILAKNAELRTSKNGNEFATATIKVPSAEGDSYNSVTAFGDLAPILAGLQRGDPVTIIGAGKVNVYQGKDGETKAGLSVVASRIIALADSQTAVAASSHPSAAPANKRAAKVPSSASQSPFQAAW